MSFPDESVGFDPEAFDNAIREHGVPLVHMRGMRCPVGLIDMDDIRRPHDHDCSCSNGFIYTYAGTFRGVFQGNSKQDQMMDVGVAAGAVAYIVCHRFYDSPDGADPQEFMPAPFDRIYLADQSVTVVHWQLFQTHPDKKDRLSFPPVKIIDVMDAHGKRYYEGKDLIVDKGGIKWIGDWPGLDPKTGKGVVVAIRYTYLPHYYVKANSHEVRVIQMENDFTGEQVTVRMPQSLNVQREYIYLKEQRNEEVENKERQVYAAPDGIFGPR